MSEKEDITDVRLDTTNWRKTIQQSALYILVIPAKDIDGYQLAVEKFKFAMSENKMILLTIEKNMKLPLVFEVESKRVNIFRYKTGKIDHKEFVEAINSLCDSNKKEV